MIKNLSSNEEVLISELRKISEDRGLIYYYLLKTAQDKGFEIEGFARKAIRKLGQSNKYRFPDTNDLREVVGSFSKKEVNRKIFEKDVVDMDEKQATIHFHYCPMTSIWIKLTNDQKFIQQICDIAMEVDRGLFDTYDCLDFSLGKTICDGSDICELFFYKVEKRKS